MKHVYSFLGAFLLLVAVLPAQNTNVTYQSHIDWGESCANICGYTDPANGREYALVGAASGMRIVEVTDPANPVEITQIPHVNNLWKEIKVYSHYAYHTTEGGGGLQIIDLSNLPNPTLAYHAYTGDGAIAGQLNTIHALHVDVTKGFVYLYGTNINNQGAVVLDLNADPYNPTYAGAYDEDYIHDGYADNDTLYSSHIYAGNFRVVDMTDKNNPVVLSTTQTPGNFTHNTWPNAAKTHVFTTDEVDDSFLAAYNISNLNNITETDRIQSNPGSNSIVHNTHIRDEYAVTSWYKDGFTIVDVSRPHNLIQVGNYDNFTGSGGGFDGCWGVYPFFPSGTIIASNMNDGLWVFSPNYVRGCYLEGTITNANTGAPILGASAQIVGSTAESGADQSDVNGYYATGQLENGTYQATYSAVGYVSQTLSVSLVNGQLTLQDVALVPLESFNVTVTAVKDIDGQPVQSAKVLVVAEDGSTYTGTTAFDGMASFSIFAGNYTVYVGKWGYREFAQSNVAITGQANIDATLDEGYEDDFLFDFNWVKTTNGATSGFWEKDEPVGTTLQNDEANPEFDLATDFGDECYVTGNGGGQAGNDDVDNGSVTLTSPPMDLSGYQDATVNYSLWFFNGGGQSDPNDYLRVYIKNDTQTVLIEELTASASGWRPESSFSVAQHITLTDDVRIVFVTEDQPQPTAHLVEAGVDGFRVEFGPVNNKDIAQKSSLSASPNPFSDETIVRYALGGDGLLELTDIAGRTISSVKISGNGSTVIGTGLPSGVYFVRIMSQGSPTTTIKVVKQ